MHYTTVLTIPLLWNQYCKRRLWHTYCPSCICSSSRRAWTHVLPCEDVEVKVGDQADVQLTEPCLSQVLTNNREIKRQQMHFIVLFFLIQTVRLTHPANQQLCFSFLWLFKYANCPTSRPAMFRNTLGLLSRPPRRKVTPFVFSINDQLTSEESARWGQKARKDQRTHEDFHRDLDSWQWERVQQCESNLWSALRPLDLGTAAEGHFHFTEEATFVKASVINCDNAGLSVSHGPNLRISSIQLMQRKHHHRLTFSIKQTPFNIWSVFSAPVALRAVWSQRISPYCCPSQRKHPDKNFTGYLCPQGQRKGNSAMTTLQTKAEDQTGQNHGEWSFKEPDLGCHLTTAAALYCLSSSVSRNAPQLPLCLTSAAVRLSLTNEAKAVQRQQFRIRLVTGFILFGSLRENQGHFFSQHLSLDGSCQVLWLLFRVCNH